MFTPAPGASGRVYNDNLFALRRAWHLAMSAGRYGDAWGILGELGERADVGSMDNMVRLYQEGEA